MISTLCSRPLRHVKVVSAVATCRLSRPNECYWMSHKSESPLKNKYMHSLWEVIHFYGLSNDIRLGGINSQSRLQIQPICDVAGRTYCVNILTFTFSKSPCLLTGHQRISSLKHFLVVASVKCCIQYSYEHMGKYLQDNIGKSSRNIHFNTHLEIVWPPGSQKYL